MAGNGFIGKQIGNYRITAEISSGAFGSVYKAEHTHLKERIVAIKLLHAYLGSSQELEQFAQEAQFLAMLEHPHILPLIDFGFSQHQPYLIAKYAAGGTLRDLLRQKVPFPIDIAMTILTQVGQALHYAHSQNIIHRDLKPANILFNEQGKALLADFGIASMLSTASVKHLTAIGGTPPYMAPEQFQGIISKEGDQYALGCIAYELVTGQPPFSTPDFLSMGFKHLTEQPTAPSQFNLNLSPISEAAILKAMAKQRTERHADISAFLAALRAPFTRFSVPVQAPILPSLTQEQWLYVGNDHYKAGHCDEAIAAYEQAIRLAPNSALAYSNKGFVLCEFQRYDEALTAFDHAIRLDPDYVLAYHDKGVALMNLQRYDEALTAFDHAIRLDPNSAMVYNNKGHTLQDLQRYEEALVAYEQAIRLDPNSATIYNNKGFALDELQHYDEALVAYEQAIRLNSIDPIAYNNKGFVLTNLQRYDEAINAYDHAIRLSPNYATAHHNKGDALVNLQRYEEALISYEQAIRHNPTFAVAYHNKGLALHRLRRYNEAIRAYE